MTTTHDLPGGPPASPVDEGRALAGRWTIGARYERRGEVHFHHATDANGPVWVAAWRYRGFEPLPRFLVHLGHDREAWSVVRHPSVARTLDVGREVGETTCFWVVRAQPGVALSQHLAVPSAIDRAKAVSIAMQVGAALAAVHAVGLVHGAVRPDTVVLDASSSHVQLVWGGLVPRLARAGVDSGSALEDLGATAPEILAGGSASPETDVYGLAALLFTLLHGRPPLASAELGISPDLPSGLTDLIERGLRRDADLRPELRTLTDHLEDLAAELGWDVTDRPEDPPLAPLQRRPSIPPPPDRRTPTHTPRIVHRTIEPEGRRVAGDSALANTPTSAGRRHAPSTPATLSSRSVEPRADTAAFGVPILAPSPTRLQTSLVAVVLVLAVAVAAMGAAVWLRPPPAPAPIPAPAPVPVSAPATAPAPTLLTVRTDPPGAEVWEAETLLGTTPLELPLGAGDATRTLELRAEGYATHTIVQPPTTTSVQHNVVLQRERSRSPRRPPDLELREQR